MWPQRVFWCFEDPIVKKKKSRPFKGRMNMRQCYDVLRQQTLITKPPSSLCTTLYIAMPLR